MTAFSMLLRAVGPLRIRRILSAGGYVAVRTDPAQYLTAFKALHTQWGTAR